ncbi:MAG: HlyD family efflux transporter periplasmic adaptor subunit [Chloroflexota bacterium]
MRKPRLLPLLVLIFIAACSPRPPEIQPGVTLTPAAAAAPTPTPEQAGLTILADGLIQAAQPELPLAFQVGGHLLSIDVQAGDQVRKGDILARLEEAEGLDSYQSAVASAELAVLRAQQALANLDANAGAARATALSEIASYAKALRDAQYQLENYNMPLYLQGLDATEAFKQMKAGLDAALAAFDPYRYYPADNPTRRSLLQALNDAQAQYDAAVRRLNLEYDVQVAQARLDKALADYARYAAGPAPDELALAQAELANAQAQLASAQNDLEKATAGIHLIAPSDGTVLRIAVAPGARVAAGSPILVLLDAAQLQFHTTNLSERDLAVITPGQTALVTLKAYPDQPLPATVLRIGWEAGASIGDAATFPILLLLAPTPLDLRPGMTGRVEIRSEE